MNKNKYKRHALMDSENGWVCSSNLNLGCDDLLQFDKAGICSDLCTTTNDSGVGKCATCKGGNSKDKCDTCSDPNATVNSDKRTGCSCSTGFHDEGGVCVAD